jgi:dTDP-4-amino-4,6-dideoxygalactose transaminase
MTSETVPFVNLDHMHDEIAEEVDAGLSEVLRSKAFVLGPQVAAFEQAYAAYCGVQHCLGVGNGTDALELALRASGVRPGDEVIIPANTFVATAEAVLRAGAKVVLADVDDDFLLDPASVRERLTERTTAVVPVHLYGQMAQVELIAEAVGPGVAVVEDAAQSQGARRHGRRSGSLGTAAGTSFYPGKNLGAYGDAGAVTTGSAEVAKHLAKLRNHGGVRRYEHEVIGTNSRLDTVQAVVLSLKLARLDLWNGLRRDAADRYAALLEGAPGLTLPRTVPGNEHVWHLYVVQVEERSKAQAALDEAGIGTGIHYPAPIHLLPAFSYLGGRAGDHPVAERQTPRILSLPMFPGITAAQQERVAEALLNVL